MKIYIVSVTARSAVSSQTKYLRLNGTHNESVSVFFDSPAFALLQKAGYGHLANLPVGSNFGFTTAPMSIEVDKRSGYYVLTAVYTTAQPPADAPAATPPMVPTAILANYDKTVHTELVKLCYSIVHTPTLAAFGIDQDGDEITNIAICQLTTFGTLRITHNDTPASNWGVVSAHIGKRNWLVWDESPDATLETAAARMGLPPVYPTAVTRLMPVFARYIGKAGATIPQSVAFASFGIDTKAILAGFAERDKRDLPTFTPALTSTLSLLLVLKSMSANCAFNAMSLMEVANG